MDEEEGGFGKFEGVHYSINSGRECILTDPEEYETFINRVRTLGGNGEVQLRPVDMLVSQVILLLGFSNYWSF